MRIALLGYGKMGKRIAELAEERGHTISTIIDPQQKEIDNPVSVLADCDAIIDFSHPDSMQEHLSWALSANKPIVIGTTGWEIDEKLDETAKAHNTPILYGSNFSLGVQLFMKLTQKAAELFGSSDLFHAAMHEIHHTQKVDAPSGTAKTMSSLWRKESTKQKNESFVLPESQPADENTLYVTAQRLGSVFGEHTLRINSPFDDIELTHRARSRDGFASGAVKAAEWLAQQKPGFYLVENVVEKILK